MCVPIVQLVFLYLLCYHFFFFPPLVSSSYFLFSFEVPVQKWPTNKLQALMCLSSKCQTVVWVVKLEEKDHRYKHQKWASYEVCPGSPLEIGWGSLLCIKRSHLRPFWSLAKMLPRHFLGEESWTCPTGRTPWGRSKTPWRDYVSWLAWKHFSIPLEELEAVARKREVRASLLSPQCRTPSEEKKELDFWIKMKKKLKSHSTGFHQHHLFIFKRSVLIKITQNMWKWCLPCRNSNQQG